MLYRAIGLMSGSSLDGLDIVFAELNEQAGQWTYEIIEADCFAYSPEWQNKLRRAIHLNALDYQLLHTAYGHYLGEQVNRFIEDHGLQYQVGLVSSHGHTSFHVPSQRMTAQLGDGAAIAAVTGLPVVSDLRALDIAFGGQGAPIVPIGEQLLLKDYSYYLNLGGIANISLNLPGGYIAFDVCPANRVLNMICSTIGKEYDEGGAMAATGMVNDALLRQLNELDYYRLPYPKSLANEMGTDIIYPLVAATGLTPQDQLRTVVAHIVEQIRLSLSNIERPEGPANLLATGGGALNSFVIEQLQQALEPLQIKVVVPEEKLVQYKEALVMALIGVLRWRQEYNVLSSVTGASRNSIGGALWNGQEA
jgi:anhydro-N-acetylmuramic acid kinase